ncbi:hypothetical protein JYB88_09725 [Shewanella cyperi]|uniref:NrS-1 polymerase-like helicase domain-containing protein n=1 Tax=Shewanella cyperi TaxID=2814292 RepID=A0A974XHN3_9GAMM|nr:primase-helicase family protein [Shewanella cyperi]QSX28581.1 hypothetical protein JYB88_09725 [Shewanella cyperi]
MPKANDNVVYQLAHNPVPGAVDAENNPYSDEELKMLEALNQQYSHVVVGGKNKVVSLRPCPVSGKTFVFQSLDEFRQQFSHRPKIGKKQAGSAWLDWPGKNYKEGGVGFYPDPEKCPDSVFNMYRGLALTPVTGDCTPFLEFLRDVICDGNLRLFQYLICWLAHLVRRPDEKPSVALLLKSVEGTGKGTLFKPLKAILGELAVQVNGIEQITGRFNSLVANRLLVFADEVEITDTRRVNRLKGLISEHSATMEYKGIDAQQVTNYARFIFAGNSEHMLLAGLRERRYLVLEPNPAKAQDKAYFDRIYEWLEHGGPAALLAYLKNTDLSDFDPRRAPESPGLIEEKLASLSPVDSFLFEELSKGEPFGGRKRSESSYFTECFMHWSKLNNIQITLNQARAILGKRLLKLEAKKTGRVDRGDGKVMYELATPERMRQCFAANLGHDEAIFEI